MRNCSFCKLPGHSIRYCTDVRIQENINEIETTVDRLEGEDEIKNFLNSRSLIMLRLHCMRFGIKMSLTKSKYVNFLTNYYMRQSRTEFGTITPESTETEIKEYFCNYIKYYLTVIIETELPTNSIMRFIMDMNNDILQCYRTGFSQNILVFVGNIWMNIINILDPAIAVRMTNYSEVFTLINNLIIPYWEHIDVASRMNMGAYDDDEQIEYKLDIHPIMLCTESYEELQTQEECPICLTDQKKFDIITTNCNHSFCKDCIIKSITLCKNARKALSCALCRGNISLLETKNLEEYNNLCIMID
jgi:hypothetical protein